MDFIIEFKNATQNHTAGEQMKFSSDSVLIGRESDCQVLFDDSTPTVSRKHAKIEREGSRYKIIPLSQTNATYVNGSPVNGEYYLKTGDEIKLSSQGPTIIFKQEATATKATQVSVNPTTPAPAAPSKNSNKSLIAAIAAVVILAIAGVVIWMNKSSEPEVTIQNIEDCYTSIYYIKVNDVSVYDNSRNLVFTYNTEDKIVGTGFMLNNGRFVVARRVVEPWTFSEGGLVGYDQQNHAWSYNDLAALGYDIVTNCTAFTSAGTSFQFRNTDCNKDKANMQNDWMTLAKADQLGTVPGLVFDEVWGNNPKYGTECSLVGYQKGADIQNLQISNFSNAINVSELNNNQVIELSSRRWVDGLSGAPAMILKDGRWVVIGILSNSHNSQRDIVIPIGNAL